MEAIFKPEHVGQAVSDPNFGDGVITGYDHRTTYPVEVKFEPTGITRWYKPEGWHNGCVLATLQFGPLDNWQRRTERQVKDGDLVEVFNLAESQWYLGVVSTDNQGRAWATLTRSEEGLALNMKMLLQSKWRFFKP